jgi:hypothetical protein
LRIVGGQRHEDADLPHPIRLLRVRDERRPAAYQDDELGVS